MALRMDWLMRSGLEVENAYITCESKKVKTTTTLLEYVVRIYKDANKFAELEPCYATVINATDPIYSQYFAESIVKEEGKSDSTQGYLLLKTLDGNQSSGFALPLAGHDFTAATDD